MPLCCATCRFVGFVSLNPHVNYVLSMCCCYIYISSLFEWLIALIRGELAAVLYQVASCCDLTCFAKRISKTSLAPGPVLFQKGELHPIFSFGREHKLITRRQQPSKREGGRKEKIWFPNLFLLRNSFSFPVLGELLYLGCENWWEQHFTPEMLICS